MGFLVEPGPSHNRSSVLTPIPGMWRNVFLSITLPFDYSVFTFNMV